MHRISTRHPRRASLVALTIALAAVLVLIPAPRSASAGEFTITACQADAGDFASGAFEDFATRGMRWRRACSPLGPGLRGLVTSNVASSSRVAHGSQSSFVLSAPPGTAFSRLRWSGHAQRRDCRYALQVYAERPDGSDATIKNVKANRNCPRPDLAQASSWPRPRAFDLGGATRIVQRIVCVGSPSAQFCSGRGQNYMQTFTAEATVVDESGPSVAIAPTGPLARGEWVSGTQSLGYEASDNVGVRSGVAYVGSVRSGEEVRGCDYAQRIPCPSGSGQIEIDTRRVAEGTQAMHITAEDAARNVADSPTVSAHIDNTAPGTAAVGVEGGETWRNRNDYSVAWENAGEVDRAPITSAHYRLCRVGGSECTTGGRSGTGISRIDSLAVPAPGEWELRLWRGDAAGNEQPDNASLPVKMLFDPEPPQVGFEGISTEDPTRIAAQVTDPISGLGGGEIEISQVGSGVWKALPTTQDSDHLVTRVDDASLPPGDYELRATARDKANNLASTTNRLDGQPMILKLPLRIASSIKAGVLRKRTVHRTVKRHGKSHTVRHKVKTLAKKAQVDFGQHVTLAGTLLDRAGKPVGGAVVQVYALPPEGEESQLGSLTTDADGRFSYKTEGRQSEQLRFVYSGTATRLPAEEKAVLLVTGGSTLEASKSHLLNGESLVFSGRVRGRPLPAAGKLIEMQVRLSDKWNTFRTIRSDAHGRWHLLYRFLRTCGVQIYRFRARATGEAPYPLEPGESPVLAIRVRGRPCLTG